jgi:hypothetical protein
LEPAYRVKLMFEWGGGCLWCGNQAALDRFDVGPIEERLPISEQARGRLLEMSQWHDGALNWDDPAGDSPWSAAERIRFDQAASELLEVLRQELGPEYEVVYEPL